MVFICFPNVETDEEAALRRKYDKLKKKRASLVQLKSAKPEPKPTTLTMKKSTCAKDAQKVIEKLKRTGALPQIKLPERKPVGSGFKRKVPGGSVAVANSPVNSSSPNIPSDRPPQRLFKPPSRAPNLNGPSGSNKPGEAKVEHKWSAIAGRKDDRTTQPPPDTDLKRELISYDDDIF